MDTKEYEVEFTEECLHEIRKVYRYITDNLYTENSAKNLMNMVEEYTNNLAYSPRIYAEIPKYRGADSTYRRIVIRNYVILYTIDEEHKKVYISHMYYGASNYMGEI